MSRETRPGPASLERDTHQRLGPLVAEHPSPIHPGVRLVIDAGAPHRLISGGHRARHEQIPAGSRGIAFHLDVAIQAVMDREGEDARRSLEETPDRLAPLEAAQRGAFPNGVLGEQTRDCNALAGIPVVADSPLEGDGFEPSVPRVGNYAHETALFDRHGNFRPFSCGVRSPGSFMQANRLTSEHALNLRWPS